MRTRRFCRHDELAKTSRDVGHPLTAAVFDTIGVGYAPIRQPDARLGSAIDSALGDAETVINVGAGAGSYEPRGKFVIAVDPSATMIRQRSVGSAPAVQGTAEALPLPDRCADAAMALHTVVHWTDLRRGLAEMRRVARRVVLLTIDPDVARGLWIVADYVPEMISGHLSRLPAISTLVDQLPGARVVAVPVPSDCTDRFLVALWARPEAYLDAEVRRATSPWHQIPASASERAVERLKVEIEDGSWDRRYGHLRGLDSLDVGLRLVIADLPQRDPLSCALR